MSKKSGLRAGDKPVARAAIYLRVSTPRQAHTDADAVDDGNSIDTQRKEALNKVRQLGAVLAEDAEYIDPGTSAQSIAKRPSFRDMLKRITEQRDIDYVVVYMRSRAFRNALEAMMTKHQLKQLGVKLVSAKEDFGEGIYADAMEALADVFNELEVRRNGEDIKLKMANKVKNGGTPSKAKLGYLNTSIMVDGFRVNTIAIDQERMPLIMIAFELFATGQHTIESLHQVVTDMGLRSRPTKHRPHGSVITRETLRTILRDRYYIGWVTYKGMEYQGRHETFISEELFERVQRVLDSHQGAGVRERTHPHYLKGWLWCHRCGKRFVVQRAVGRHGGEYYYFFCIGRQHGTCDHPYVPVEKMEQAIEAHYAASVRLPEDFRAEIRAMVHEAADDSLNLTDELRERYTRRLSALDKKESYLLDLAAEEGWPKEKLRQKIGEIRTERGQLERSLHDAQGQLDAGREIIYKALALLDNPAELYKTGNEAVRSTLNKAIFVKFMIDGQKVVESQRREPFDTLHGVYQRRQARVYYRASGPLREGLEAEEGVVPGELRPVSLEELEQRWFGLGGGAGLAAAATQAAEHPASLTGDGVSELSLTDLLDLALHLRVRGSSKAVMVGDTGIEPVTPSV